MKVLGVAFLVLCLVCLSWQGVVSSSEPSSSQDRRDTMLHHHFQQSNQTATDDGSSNGSSNISNHHNDTTTSSNETQFCNSKAMPMTMFMDGFHSSLFAKIWHNSTSSSAASKLRCLSYYVAPWRLTDSGRFVGAMVYSFLLAFLLEGISALRGVTVQACEKRPMLGHALLTLIYFVQAWLGFVVMLSTMAFSTEMLCSVVAGLMAGNLVFMRYDDVIGSSQNKKQQTTARRTNGGDEGTPLLLGNNNNEVL